MSLIAITSLEKNPKEQFKITKLLEDFWIQSDSSVKPFDIEIIIYALKNSDPIKGFNIYIEGEITNISDVTWIYKNESYNNYLFGKGNWDLNLKLKNLMLYNENINIEKINISYKKIKNYNIITVLFEHPILSDTYDILRIRINTNYSSENTNKILNYFFEKSIDFETRIYDQHVLELYKINVKSEELIQISEVYVWVVIPLNWIYDPGYTTINHGKRFLEITNPWNEKGGKHRQVLWWKEKSIKNQKDKWLNLCFSVKLNHTPSRWITFFIGIIWGIILTLILDYLIKPIIF